MLGSWDNNPASGQIPEIAESSGRYQLKTVTFWPPTPQEVNEYTPIGIGTILFDTETGEIQNPVTVTVGGEYDVAIGPEISEYPLYQIIPNARGGCYVFDPTNGETFAIDQRGNEKQVLTNRGLYISSGPIVYK